MTRGRLRRPCGCLTALPAVVLVDELLPLARGQVAIPVPVLAQALALLRRHGAELLVAPLEHLLPLLGELLVALVVLPRTPLLLGGELLPRPPVPLLGARGRRREREQDDGDGGPAPHPFEGGSCPSGVAGSSSSVVVWIASKCIILSRLRMMGTSPDWSGASASLAGGSAGGGPFTTRRGGGAGATSLASPLGAGRTAGAPGTSPARRTMPIASTSTAAVARANAGSGSQRAPRLAGARSASSAAASRPRRRVACP